jgi:hypothetical protein
MMSSKRKSVRVSCVGVRLEMTRLERAHCSKAYHTQKRKYGVNPFISGVKLLRCVLGFGLGSVTPP